MRVTSIPLDIDLDTLDTGLGTLFIEDDSHITLDPRILRLGIDKGRFTIHVMSANTPGMSKMRLHGDLYSFVENLCQTTWCGAHVVYMIGNEVMDSEFYGSVDGEYTIDIKVHGRGVRGGSNGFYDIFGKLLSDASPEDPLVTVEYSEGALRFRKMWL